MKTYIATPKMLGELAKCGVKVNILHKEKFFRGNCLCSVIEYTKEFDKFLIKKGFKK